MASVCASICPPVTGQGLGPPASLLPPGPLPRLQSRPCSHLGHRTDRLAWRLGPLASRGSQKRSQEPGATTLQPGLAAPVGKRPLISPYSPCGHMSSR